MMTEGARYPLTWVNSFAGSGKTCSVARFVEDSKRPCVWLHVDQDDAEPSTFIHYLTQAVHTVKRSIEIPTVVPEHNFGLASFFRHYCRALFPALPPGCLIVLDNYETLPSACPLHALLAESMMETPPEISWIIISRHEPEAAFIRLRSHEKLFPLGWEVLRFQQKETQALVRHMLNTDLPLACVNQLHEISEGWVAGTVLALEEVKNLGFLPEAMGVHLNELSGQQAIFDYFATEIFNKLSTAEQRFLVITAHLSEIGEDVAHALSNYAETHTLLKTLRRKHYFSPNSTPTPAKHRGNVAIAITRYLEIFY